MNIEDITYDDTKLEDLNFFWTKSGVPCFIADRDNMEETIENLGFNIYYMICNTATDRKVETKNVGYGAAPATSTVTYVTDLSTNVVKVVNNFVGRSVSIVKDEDLYDFHVTREDAEYSLPPIPHDIVTKLDEFFRLVEAQHGTESIVLLTFDPSKDDSSGWGVLVPDQVNTAVHCKYDAESIVDQKPEDVMIVGSVHSHPNMAAYASGTDHADQADFDGLHITYGWQKSVNGGATQYHIEMQIGGAIWTLKPEDVFEDFIFAKDPDPEVVEWSQKVKKVSPPTGGAKPTHLTPQSSTPPQTTTTPQVGSTQAGPTTDYKPVGDPSFQEYPSEIFAEAVKSNEALFIVEVDAFSPTKFCYSCSTMLDKADLDQRVCSVCDIMLCDMADPINSLLLGAKKYLELRNKPVNMDYYIWSADDEGAETFAKINTKSSSDYDSTSLSLIKDNSFEQYPISDDVDEYYYSGFSENRTVCCDTPIARIEQCTCPNTVLYDDILDFDQAHPYDVYDRASACNDCQHYYSRECEPYLNSILEYVKTKRPLESSITTCSHWTESKEVLDNDSYFEKGYLYD